MRSGTKSQQMRSGVQCIWAVHPALDTVSTRADSEQLTMLSRPPCRALGM